MDKQLGEAAILEINPRVGSVTFEILKFRGEGYELLQEQQKQNGSTHSLTKEQGGLWVQLFFFFYLKVGIRDGERSLRGIQEIEE